MVGEELSGIPASRMASLLRSWVLLAAFWGVGQLLISLLVLRQVELTASALWTTALVSGCQALALESLTAPLGLGVFLARAAGSLRRPRARLLWLLTGAAGVAAHLLTGGRADLLTALAAVLGVLAAILFAFAAWRPGGLRPARPALTALALLVLLAAIEPAHSWLTQLPAWLLPDWPQTAARSLLVALFVTALYSALFRVQRRLAGRCTTASGWLGAAAGVGAVGLAARLLPLSLMTSIQDGPSLGTGILLILVSTCLVTAGLCFSLAVEEAGSGDSLDRAHAAGARRTGSPTPGAVALIATLAAVVGLVLAHSLLTLPVALTAPGALVSALVIAGQTIAWFWLGRRERPLPAAARRLVAAHPALAVWTGAEWVGLAILWSQRTASWSRVAPVWETVAIYGGARAALLALLVVGLLVRRQQKARAAGAAPSSARPSSAATAAHAPGRMRLLLQTLLLAVALAAPALLPIVGSRPAWQNAAAAGLFTLLGMAFAAPAGAVRDTWLGLALLLGWPAAALALATLTLGEVGLPLTAPLALSCLLPALGLATLAAPALFSSPRDDGE